MLSSLPCSPLYARNFLHRGFDRVAGVFVAHRNYQPGLEYGSISTPLS
jgi:hypothetical protein